MTPDDRRAIKQKMPQTHLSAEHVQNCRLVPDRLAMLDVMPKGGIVAEIGVAFGDFTREIVARSKPDILYLVDSWNSERYKKGLMAIEAEHADAICAGRVHIEHGLSTEVMPQLADNAFDWLYIDTDHSYETTWAELNLAKQKVKQGGLIAGHDFCNGNIITPWPYGVVEACLKFCVDYGWEFRYLTVEVHGHQSFVLGKIS